MMGYLMSLSRCQHDLVQSECGRSATFLQAGQRGLAGDPIAGSSGRPSEMWRTIVLSSQLATSCTKAKVGRRVPRLDPFDAQVSRNRSPKKDKELWCVRLRQSICPRVKFAWGKSPERVTGGCLVPVCSTELGWCARLTLPWRFKASVERETGICHIKC
ncbi:hypothetical protein GW17_00041902 [Ensete ventricosum]|nr:hypothetical protein GW17_00041902 [Ensete ventricosum]